MRIPKKNARTACSAILACWFALLCACGGGGGSGGADQVGNDGGGAPNASVPAAPAPTLTLHPVKAFRFDWADVAGETEYRLLEDPDGTSGYTQVAAIASDSTAYEHIVPLPKRVGARYILQACNSAGCSDSAPIIVAGSLIEAVGYVKASNTDEFDGFGYAVALSSDGNTLAVGSYHERSSATGIDGDQDDNTAIHSGAVYVFARNGSTWTQQAYVKASNTAAFDQFGASLALSADGSTLVVGAPHEASSATGIDGDQADNSALNAGAVYVFVRTGGTWMQQAYVKASNNEAGDQFGLAVALSADGNTLAVGATGEDSGTTGIDSTPDEAARSAGAVYVFTRGGGFWTQQAYVKASNAGVDHYFGHCVSLSADGDTLAVGAVGESSRAIGVDGDQHDNLAKESGAVYVFGRSGNLWAQQAYVKASNTEPGDEFGRALTLSGDGNTLAVGAPFERSGATGIDGDQADNSAGHAGAVYVFTRDAGGWAQQAYVKASHTGIDMMFGWSVALSDGGGTLAVGAIRESSASVGLDGDQADDSAINRGAAYVFVRNVTAWQQRAYVKASNPGTGHAPGSGDYFGWDVALSGDGDTLAVGAVEENGSSTGVNGPTDGDRARLAGAVYLY